MSMVNVVTMAAYGRIYWLSWSAWSKGRQKKVNKNVKPCLRLSTARGPCLRATFVRLTGWTLAVAVHCYGDSTVNIVVAITITIRRQTDTTLYAFRPTGSTTAALIYILQSVTDLLADNPYVSVIALDCSKAFDTVRHYPLLETMAQLDLPDAV